MSGTAISGAFLVPCEACGLWEHGRDVHDPIMCAERALARRDPAAMLEARLATLENEMTALRQKHERLRDTTQDLARYVMAFAIEELSPPLPSKAKRSLLDMLRETVSAIEDLD